MDTRNDLRAFLKESEKKSASLQHNSCDELVKYMSKLPPYLQADNESLQSCNNVLNVGVLDWSRLEKWKQHGRASGDKTERKVHACSNLRKVKAASRDLQHSLHTLEPELASRDSQEIATCSSYKSSARDHERGKSRRRSPSFREPDSGLLSTMGNSGGSLGVKGNFVVRDKETEKRAGELHAQEARERASESRKQQCAVIDGEEKTVGDSNHQVSNIVLLRSSRQSQMTRDFNCSLDGINSSSGLTSQVPRSCPLLERDSEDVMVPLLGVDQRFGGTRRHSKTGSRIFDQEDESRHPTSPPSKRFSFSFGRLSRSFTFKEDAQPLTSSDDTIKSMTFDDPSQSEKHNTRYCGSRVSPLRRLLDPLLKSKGSEDALLPSKAKSSTSSNPKPAASRRRAVFQLTIRNGIPLFQFVVDDNNNRRSILGATMKSSSFKDEYCTFYSVNEVKKKKSGSWLVHAGHKEKQDGFVYNVIGQMRLCNSMSSDITCVIREAVLVDESEQVKEVAALVIKKKKLGEENLTALGETTVIIPGGVHSIPEKGKTTPLISRWRSGGLCDCGGWDVGCKLHVLSNRTFLDQSFKLFDQEESDQNSGPPVLAMTELKTGIYSVEFGSVLSHLQAFFVCVTVVTCASDEETVSKNTGKSSSPFAPPVSPVGRA